jgi:hypothetical protein
MITTFERSGLTFSITPLRHTAEVSEELIEHLQVGMAASCTCRVASKSLENGRAGSKRYRWILRLWRPMSVVAPRATIQGVSAK